jgi:hypothetical protein
MTKRRWPRKMVIQELFINDNGLENHVHVASCDRKKLIRLAKVAIHHFGGEGTVREFPPFDSVDCVHTNGSFHYRQSGQCSTPRNCSNRGDGLAFDLGCARREEFAREVKRRYKVLQSDF